MERTVKLVKDILVPLITAITAVMVLFLNNSVNKANLAIDGRLKELASQREERESIQDFNLKIYEIVIGSLETGDLQQQEAAKAFVVVMVDEPLRASLLSVLEQGGEPQIQQDVGQILEEEGKFKAENVELVPPNQKQRFNWEDWDYDIFWCTSSGSSAEFQANQIKDALLSEGAEGRIRVRELPDSINARSGYQIRGYAIRKNSGEDNQAAALKGLAESTLELSDGTFTIGLSTQPTPWYISAFICP
jgi:hypothetical protein